MANEYELAKGVKLGNESASRECHDCGASMQGKRQAYRYKECGLSNVTLSNILVFECSCGARLPEIPAIQQLHVFITLDLLSKESLLSGEEIRFLRRMAGLTQSELAEIIGVDKTRPSKWEKGGESTIGKENDRVLRSCFLVGMLQQTIGGEEGHDPVALTKASTEMIRKLDVKKLFKAIVDKSSGPKTIGVENNPSSPDEPWFLTGSGPASHGAAIH